MEDKNVPSETQTDYRRAAIEAAFAHVEEQEPEAIAEKAVEAVEPVEKEEKPVEASEPKEEPAAEEHEEAKDEPAEKEVKADRAPQSWKPEAREAWAELPESAKREISRREREVATTLQQTAEECRFAQEIQTSFKPYETDLRSAGLTPKAVVEDLLNTAQVLRRGAPEQRAHMVASIIREHGVDLVALNDLLSKPQAAPRHDPVAQRVAHLEAAEQQRQAAAQRQHDAAIEKDIDAFAKNPKNEFFNDVAPMMVAFLESGQSKTLDEAYEKAVWANPDTRKVLTSRQNQTQTKLNAASSIKGTGPKGSTQGRQPSHADRRSAIEAAFDSLAANKKRF